MQPPVAAVFAAHRRPEKLVAGLSDQQVADASGLPGRSRGHVLAHLGHSGELRAAEHEFVSLRLPGPGYRPGLRHAV